MRLNIAYACGEEYARHAGVSMISLFENNKDFDEIYVYLIDNGMTEDTKNILLEITNSYGRNAIIKSCDDLCKQISVNTEKYPISTYSKLFLGQLDEIDKIIYLDCDTSVTGSFKELWELDISGYYVAGVWDDAAPRLKAVVGVNGNDPYINCGFVLMNLDSWRKYRLEEKSIEFINKYNGDVPFLDQGVVNGICKNHTLLLEPNYNLMSYMLMFKANQIEMLCRVDKMYTQREIDNAIDNPIVIHWVNGCYNRPWTKNCTHPLKERYLYYLEMSPWASQFLDHPLSKQTKFLRFLYLVLPFSLFNFLRKVSDNSKGKSLRGKY
ncbi:glycosyltransferase family 8 protein [Psychrobacillus psychrodurans]|uniref:Glycosyltransferase family 8 protein n=1 Tax=Psychrobacillus psychrodurans TaxID=126157 RepID=A0A9X3L6E2_9BACI|nr:glycosyltransferase family 8 protein [Psychrobacillus psychrodurans]MCZ8532017.1 glycosyltransferase family 8 protein [Psychrobacillus psychrodurans]